MEKLHAEVLAALATALVKLEDDIGPVLPNALYHAVV